MTVYYQKYCNRGKTNTDFILRVAKELSTKDAEDIEYLEIIKEKLKRKK